MADEERHRESWAAFAAGIFWALDPALDALARWDRVVVVCRSMAAGDSFPYTADQIRRLASDWAVANLPPSTLIGRRWFD